jgi:hypothetical protein
MKRSSGYRAIGEFQVTMRFALVLGLLLAILIMSGCQHSITRYDDIDVADKSMMVGAGDEGILGGIKTGLRKEGWRLVVITDNQTPDAIPPGSKPVVVSEVSARYTLHGNFEESSRPLFGGTEYNCRITVIDNKTGMKALVIVTHGSIDYITYKLLYELGNETDEKGGNF